jgi:cell division protein FtsL
MSLGAGRWSSGFWPLVLLGSLLLYVTQGIQVIGMGYEIDRLQNNFRAVKAERERLEVELASLQELATVQREAVERLGMVFPEAGQVVVVRETAGAPVAQAAAPTLTAARRD